MSDYSYIDKAGHRRQLAFWSRAIRSPGGCLLWQGRKNAKGYGWIALRGKSMHTHRAAWIISRGEIPSGRWVLHTCDTPSCVEPSHLYLGTPADNNADCVRRGRHRTIRGEKSPHAKLNDVAVRVIRYLVKHGRTRSEIARAYGMSLSVIADAASGKRWKHVA